MGRCRLFSDINPRFCDGMNLLLANGTMHVLWRMEDKRAMAVAVMVREAKPNGRHFQVGQCPHCNATLETCESTDGETSSTHVPASYR